MACCFQAFFLFYYLIEINTFSNLSYSIIKFDNDVFFIFMKNTLH